MINYKLPATFFALLLALSSYCQPKPSITALNRFTINNNDTLYTFFAKKPVKPITIIKGKTYYWYDGTTIHTTQEGYDGRVLDGEYKVAYPNNNLKEKGWFSHGIKDGKWQYWQPDGTIKEVQVWKEGEQQIVKKKKAKKKSMKEKKPK